MSTLTDHGHDHGAHQTYLGPAVTFAILGPVEILVGLLLRNPTITSLGGHDAGDALYPVLGWIVTWVSSRAGRRWTRSGTRWRRLIHSLSCQLPVYTGLGMGVANIAVIGVLPVLTAPRALSWTVALAGSGIGVISFIANRYWAAHFTGQSHDHDASMQSHFRLDMYASIATIIGSVLTAGTGDINWVILGVGTILGLSLIETLPQLRQTKRRLHSVLHHPATDLQQDEH